MPRDCLTIPYHTSGYPIRIFDRPTTVLPQTQETTCHMSGIRRNGDTASFHDYLREALQSALTETLIEEAVKLAEQTDRATADISVLPGPPPHLQRSG